MPHEDRTTRPAEPDSRLPRAIVIGVGDELLLGRVVDTNAAWLGSELAAMGLPLHRHVVVGDEVEEIEAALLSAVASADTIFVTGGLGPTHDDRTRDAAARALGRPLRRDETLESDLLRRSAGLGRPAPSADYLSQAEVPEGAMIVKNALGSAPGLILEVKGKVVVLLPGVPFEMKGLFRDGIAPYLRERFGASLRPVRFRVLRTAGMPESVLAERLAPVLPSESDPVNVAFLPRLGNVEVRLTVRETSVPGEAEAWLARVENEVAPLLDPYLFHSAGGELGEAVAEAVCAAGMRVAIAESCTGGWLGKSLTDQSGASGYFAGGIIAYADEVKIRELSVDPELLQRVGAVSRETAEAMATGVARRFDVDIGLAITGIAGPGGGTDEKPVGTVWYAISVGEQVQSAGERFPGGRAEIRERSVQAVLALLLRKIKQVERPKTE